MIDPQNMNDLADAEDRGNVVDQQTAAEAGIEKTLVDRGPQGGEAAVESEAHPS